MALYLQFSPTIVQYLYDAARRSASKEGGLAKNTEIRPVTVLFIGMTLVDPTTKEPVDIQDPCVLQQAFVRSQQLLAKYGAMLRQFLYDDKGTVLIAGLGTPMHVHEDDPDRGLNLAMELQANLAEVNVLTRIGVTTGKAFCGLVGSATRQEYMMVGSVVNLSAKLMVGTDYGTVRCDARTAEYASAEKFDFVPLDPVSVKGMERPVATYKPERPEVDANSFGSKRCYGRHDEKDIIEDLLDRFNDSDSRCSLVVVGTAGIGKSTFARYVKSEERPLPLLLLLLLLLPRPRGGGGAAAAATAPPLLLLHHPTTTN